MKKTLITTSFFLIVIILIIIFKNEVSNVKKKYSLIKAGDQAINFTLGIYDSKNITLNDFIGKTNIILAFLNETPFSQKTELMLEKFYDDYLKKRKDILLFFLKKSGSFIIIEEKTDYTNLKYRTLFKKIPDVYHFKTLPSILFIDRYGIIKILYNGYSPTLIQDLINQLVFIK